MAAGSIVVDLLMRTGSFETDTKRAEKRLRELKKEAEALGRGFGLAVAAVGAASVALVKSAIDAADATSKLAQQTGTTVEELSALTYAAGLADVGQEELGSGLVKLSKNMSDAAQGTGEAIKGFEALGISVKTAGGGLKSADQVFAEVADKFSGMADGAEKTALAVNIFGKSGAKLIPLLNAGASGLAEMKDEAQRLGIVLSTETARSAEEFNDNLTRMGQAIVGVGNRAATELLPALNDVSTALVELAKHEEFVSTITAVVSGALKGVIVVFQTLAVVGSDVGFVFLSVGREIASWAAQLNALASGNLQGFRAISDAVKADGERARAELDKFQARVMAIGSPTAAPVDYGNEGRNSRKPPAPRMGGGGGRSGGAAPRISEFEKTLSQQRERLALLGQETELEKINAQIVLGKFGAIKPAQADALRAGAAAIDQRRAEIDLARETEAKEKARVESIASVISALQSERNELSMTSGEIKLNQLALSGASEAEIRHAESIIKATDAMREQRAMQEAGKRLYEETRTPAEALNIELARLNTLLQSGATDWDTYARAVFNAQDKFDAASKKAEETTDSFSKKFAENAQDVLGQGLYDMAKGNFKNIGQAFGDMITRMVSEAIAADIAKSLFGSLLKGGSGDGILGSIVSSFFGGGKASGGDVIAGRSYLVGEDGPERFVPRTAGTVLPAAKTAAMRGGDTTNKFNFTIVGPVDRRTEEQIAAAAFRGAARANGRRTA